MTILVTAASSHLGHHVIDALLERDILLVVLGVPVVAQDHSGKADLGDDLLGAAVLGHEDVLGGVGLRSARVDELGDAGSGGGLDDVAVLRDALAELGARDEQH
jgi:nucleoside-diphosphate-sugar epimerase